MARGIERQTLLDFIRVWKREECLWNHRREDYNNNILRYTAYNKLLKVLERSGEKFTHDDVRKILKSLKINYSQESERRKASRLEFALDYVSPIWYFHELKFLDSCCDMREGECRLRFKEEKPDAADIEITEELVITPEGVIPIGQNRKRHRCVKRECDRKPVITNTTSFRKSSIDREQTLPMPEQKPFDQARTSAAEVVTAEASLSSYPATTRASREPAHVDNPRAAMVQTAERTSISKDDEFDVIGRNLAHKLRYLSLVNREAAMIAESLMYELIQKGHLGVLSQRTKISNGTYNGQFNHNRFYPYNPPMPPLMPGMGPIYVNTQPVMCHNRKHCQS